MNDSKQLFQIGREAANKGYNAAAYETYRQLLQIKPSDDAALYRVVCELMELGRISDAESWLGRIRKDKAPTPWLIDLALGRLRLAQFKPIDAERHFRNAWKRGRDVSETAVFLANCLFEEEKFGDANDVLLESLRTAGGDFSEVYLNLGLVKRAQADYSSARSFFLKALEIDTEYRSVKIGLDDVELCLDLPTAKAEDAKALFQRATDFDFKGYDAAAYETFRGLIQIDPGMNAALYRSIKHLIELGRISDAETCLNRIPREAAPQPWLLDVALGRLRLAQFRPFEAEGHFKNAWKEGRDSTTTAVSLADCLAKQEKFGEASDVLLEAITTVEEDRDQIFLKLGLVRRSLGDYPSARGLLLKALEIAPEDEEGKLALSDVELCLNPQATAWIESA